MRDNLANKGLDSRKVSSPLLVIKIKIMPKKKLTELEELELASTAYTLEQHEEELQREKDLETIIKLVIKYRDDRDFVDEVNKTTFPFTTKYLSYQNNNRGYGVD